MEFNYTRIPTDLAIRRAFFATALINYINLRNLRPSQLPPPRQRQGLRQDEQSQHI